MLNSMHNKEITLLTLLDLTKAFDSLDHGIMLVEKLHKYGITGTSLKWFINQLTDRMQCVKIDCTRSDFLKVNSGSPQRSVLGIFYLFLIPMKCLIFLPTRNRPLEPSNLHLYADD